MSERMTGGEAMVQAVLRHGVDTVFGLPGVQTYPIMDALQRAGNQVRMVNSRHEQGSAYMAYGYAKASARPGVFTVVPGPGVLNTGAALCTAVAGSAPVMCLTGDVPSDFLGKGRGHLHELPDQLATLRSFIKWADRADRPQDAPAVIDEGFRQMLSGKPGPVAVEMCWDTMATSALVRMPEVPAAPVGPEVDLDAIKDAGKLLMGAKRPMIMCGGGAQHASAEVLALAELLDAPVTALRSGRGVVSEDHALGVSTETAWELWQDTDLLIGIGSRCELQYLRWTGMMRADDRPAGPKLIRIEIDPMELLRLKPDVGIVADAVDGALALAKAAAKNFSRTAGARDRIAEAKAIARTRIEKIQPHVAYLDIIRAVLPRDGIFVKDICQSGFTSYFAFPVYEPRSYISSGYQGNLGYAFPTALGAKVAYPDKPVVAVVGDAGFNFAVQELATMAEHQIGLSVILFNNGALGNVKRDQQTRFEGRTIASELPNPSYAAMAESYGVAGYRVDSPAALKPVLEKSLADNKPAMIEVSLDLKDEVSPWEFIIHGAG
ncbi:MAG: thiamine pyrophosphate-binding protein [Alphaproteobacteria bacterium]|jgi:acetolactate synthase-1/2/3 large subunit|nr:thiamine pyrophosphate-binding protein [Alphaproteobacteria bacterium]MDP6257277.1 thiamine pyrophosphate-binding protein [Alphaproteobacteria bacterium]MDP7055449.1 thiamine pyrophosphate-binding protein [Alphaproteobacteria bacterium]MDP7227489.1 thiamine pyrophosphate-binding protein [Alphaproteobacteria bacterium]MDP7460615.1 thiamine pyrophosphate-binding protein [Alphaproteobacteria bacterium]|tara:strand:+ start:336 stop:1982 length:1647 start_codon:yes stop_codon:yes gene_type:complete